MPDEVETVPAAIRSAQKRFGDRPAVLEQGHRISYTEFTDLVRQAAGAFVAAGLRPGDRICLWAPNRLEWMTAALGAQYIGAVLVPLNTRYRGAEAADVLARTRARILVVGQGFLGVDHVGLLRSAAADQAPTGHRADNPTTGDPPPNRPTPADPAPNPTPNSAPVPTADPTPGPAADPTPDPTPGPAADPTPGPAADPTADQTPDPAPGPVPGLPDLTTVVTLSGESPNTVDWPSFLRSGEPSDRDQAETWADQVAPDDVADILFTSGTTGRSKGAMAGHRQTLGQARGWAARAELSAEDRYLIVNPFFHSFGYKAGFLACLLHGALIVPVAVFEAAAVLDLVQQEQITVLPGPPSLYQSLLAEPATTPRDLHSLRLAVTGAAMVPQSLIRRIGEELHVDCTLTAYGLTEAPVVTMCTPADDDHTVATTCGLPLDWAEVRILTPEPAADQGAEPTPGEVLIRGPHVMLGYLDDPQATAAAIDADGWLHTGDVGLLDERGYLRITDRIKDMFTVGGFNVYPAEVEQVIAGHPAVRDCAVIGVADERLGEVGRAYVCTGPGSSLNTDEIIGYCRRRLANFKVPRTVVLIDELPRNAGGKVVKPELRRRARTGQ